MTPVTSGVAGQACLRDADCGTGGQCLPTGQGFPGGYCIYGCAAGAKPGDPCAGGTGLCIPVSSGQLICFRDCTPGLSGDCRTGYICLDVSTDGSIGICYPNCSVNPGAVCGANRCDTSTGECLSGMCSSSSQCATSATCTSGVCECTASSNCGTGNRCYPRSGTRAGFCGCSSSAGCNAGETCDTTTGRCL
jgi:hypothetical protein